MNVCAHTSVHMLNVAEAEDELVVYIRREGLWRRGRTGLFLQGGGGGGEEAMSSV